MKSNIESPQNETATVAPVTASEDVASNRQSSKLTSLTSEVADTNVNDSLIEITDNRAPEKHISQKKQTEEKMRQVDFDSHEEKPLCSNEEISDAPPLSVLDSENSSDATDANKAIISPAEQKAEKSPNKILPFKQKSKFPDATDDDGETIIAKDPDDDDAEKKVMFNKVEAEKVGVHIVPPIPVQIMRGKLASQFASEKNIAYCFETGKFHRYDESSGLFNSLSDADTRCILCDYLDEKSELMKFPLLATKVTRSLCQEILKFVADSHPIGESAELRKCIPLKNGVLDLSTSTPQVRQYRKDDSFTYKINANYLEGAKAPKFEAFLRQSLDKDDAALLQRVLGAMLIPGNPSQTILMVHGLGGTGKSTLVTIVEKLMKKGSVADLRVNMLTERFESHAHQGKNILVAKDVDPDFLKKGGNKLKVLTGGDYYETEKKYGGKYDANGEYNIIITANKRPTINIQGDKEAWERRIILIPFNRIPAERVPNLAKVLLEEESDGIFAWLVEGYLLALEEINKYGTFKLTETQKQQRSYYIDESQSVKIFTQERLASGDGDLALEDAFSEYVKYCSDRDWIALGQNIFYKEFTSSLAETYGITVKARDIIRNDRQVRGFRNVRLKRLAA